MARVSLTVQSIVRSGLNPAMTSGDAANDHSFENLTEDIYIEVDNQGTGACQVTILTSVTIDGEDVDDKIVSVPGGERRNIGPFLKDVYNQEDAGNSIDEAVLVDIDQDSNVEIAAIRLPVL